MNNTNTETNIVIFRKWNDGGITAVFPEIPADNSGYRCSSYEHIGQHSACEYGVILKLTVPAKAKEYKSLFKELIEIGYKLKVVKRLTARMTLNRQKNAKLNLT